MRQARSWPSQYNRQNYQWKAAVGESTRQTSRVRIHDEQRCERKTSGYQATGDCPLSEPGGQLDSATAMGVTAQIDRGEKGAAADRQGSDPRRDHHRKEFPVNPFARFMSSTTGSATRVVAGAGLIVVGGLIGGAGWILAAVGLIPLLAGVFDVCLFAPLFKAPFAGKKARAEA